MQPEGSFTVGSDFSLVVSCGLSCPTAYKIFAHQPGIEPHIPCIERQTLNHWTSREVPILTLVFILPVHLLWRRQWHPTPVLLPGKSHEWRSLVGCGPWGHYESDTINRLHLHFSVSRIGEGNGNPLQCSCLRIPGTGEPGGLLSMGSYRVGHD